MNLFNRNIALRIDGVTFQSRFADGTTQSTVRIAFDVEKSLASEPNVSRVSVWNMREAHRKAIKKNSFVQIEAGYGDKSSILAIGDVSLVEHGKETTDWVTKLEFGDGLSKYRSTRISTTIDPSVTLADTILSTAQRMGLNTSGLQAKLSNAAFRQNKSSFPTGWCLNGRASDVMTRLVKTAGYEWSIQDGRIQILKAGGKDLATPKRVQLDASSGLIGSVEIGEDREIKARSLLRPDLTPGKGLQLISATVSGAFQIQKARHHGDTHGSDWFTELECTAL